MKKINLVFSLLLIATFFMGQSEAQALKDNPVLDARVKKFLSDHSGQWHDMNIPVADGQAR